jgi:hypothetical protein
MSLRSNTRLRFWAVVDVFCVQCGRLGTQVGLADFLRIYSPILFSGALNETAFSFFNGDDRISACFCAAANANARAQDYLHSRGTSV